MSKSSARRSQAADDAPPVDPTPPDPAAPEADDSAPVWFVPTEADVPPPYSTPVQTLPVQPDDLGVRLVVVQRPKNGDHYNFVNVGPFLADDETTVRVQAVPSQDDVIAVYAGGRWRVARIETDPYVTKLADAGAS